MSVARDILCHAITTLRCYSIVACVHDELMIEADPSVSLEILCEQMGRTPPWAEGLILRADGYTTSFYKKEQIKQEHGLLSHPCSYLL